MVRAQRCARCGEKTARKNENLEYLKLPMDREKADFCGKSLYRPQVSRNPKLALIHYQEQAQGLFTEHTEEEQVRLMQEYCKRYQTEKVVCCCHYCLEGLLAGGVNAMHLAELQFGEKTIRHREPEKTRKMRKHR